MINQDRRIYREDVHDRRMWFQVDQNLLFYGKSQADSLLRNHHFFAVVVVLPGPKITISPGYAQERGDIRPRCRAEAGSD